jgi:hypothetical protein
MNGADGSTTFTDAGPRRQVITPAGNARIRTANSKWNGSSGYFDGTGDYLAAGTDAAFAFGTGDFTVEFWLYLIATATNNAAFGSCLIDTRDGGFQGHGLFVRSSGSIRAWDVNSFANDSASSAVPFNAWCHVASCRAAGTHRLFVDGVQVVSYASTYNFTAQALTVAGVVDARDSTANFKLEGYMADLRITTGSGRYAAAFVPPTLPLPQL